MQVENAEDTFGELEEEKAKQRQIKEQLIIDKQEEKKKKYQDGLKLNEK